MSFIKMFIYVFLFAIIINCSKIEDMRIVSQKSGPWQTNSYLLYDAHSKEAVLVDVGVSVDTLINHINKNDLKLKYVFI
ncbi:MAG: MBL fold metallo-hydrolase, partial [Calditrichia bacterium]|nr:MBL fold metallo-hydrolase [Calditrichia bacterium]